VGGEVAIVEAMVGTTTIPLADKEVLPTVVESLTCRELVLPGDSLATMDDDIPL
jgi:hypothetical protein